MKKICVYGLIMLGVLGVVIMCAESTRAATDSGAAAQKPARVLRHVVLFKFKDGTTPEQIKKVEAAFCELPKKIPTISAFEWGTDVSPEKMSQGFTHCFLVTFKTEEDRNAYLPSQAHKDFVEVLKPYLDKALVVDYWTN
jgi:hypothetical protein